MSTISPATLSYSFNPDFDRKTSYRTRSLLVVPLVTTEHVILGVIQLINALGPDGEITPFSMQDRLYITEFARNAANAIEKAKLSREMVLRMVELAELRDPYETSQHAKRVGKYSKELWNAWALRHGVDDRKNKQQQDLLLNAAILHDVGKVALSDVILRKPGGLQPDEIEQMRSHTIHGARLFRIHPFPLGPHGRRGGPEPPRTVGRHGLSGKDRQPLCREDPLRTGEEGKGDPPVGPDRRPGGRVRRPHFQTLLQGRLAGGAGASLHPRAGGPALRRELVQIFLRIYDVIRAIRRRYV